MMVAYLMSQLHHLESVMQLFPPSRYSVSEGYVVSLSHKWMLIHKQIAENMCLKRRVKYFYSEIQDIIFSLFLN